MIMIIGGASQGKLAYAKKLFPNIHWIDGSDCDEQEIFSCQGIYHFQDYIKRRMKMYDAKKEDSLKELLDFAGELIQENPKLIIVTDEIGYGIVPMDAFEREYRENVGRVCTKLAHGSKEVHRVICGIGTKIKG